MARKLGVTNNLGYILLAAFLILWGLAQFVPSLAALGPIIAILAIAAGLVLLFVGI